MTEAAKALSPETLRKQAQRARDEAMGLARKELKFSTREGDMLRFGCLVRGGLAAPYDANEYMLTLIRNDYARLLVQLDDLQGSTCEQCRQPLPLGCGGDHPGYATCGFTRGPRSLLL